MCFPSRVESSAPKKCGGTNTRGTSKYADLDAFNVRSFSDSELDAVHARFAGHTLDGHRVLQSWLHVEDLARPTPPYKELA